MEVAEVTKNASAVPSRRQTAIDFAGASDEEVSIILAELAESAGSVARSWHLAMGHMRSDPKRALGYLADAEVRLDNHVRIELADALRKVRILIKHLDAELPDEG